MKRAADDQVAADKEPMSREEQVGSDTPPEALTDLYFFYIIRPHFADTGKEDKRLNASVVRRIQPERMCTSMRQWIESQQPLMPSADRRFYERILAWQKTSYAINGAYRAVVRTPEQQTTVEEFNEAITALALPRNIYARDAWILYRGENGKGQFSLYRMAMRSKATGKPEMTRRPYSLTWHLLVALNFADETADGGDHENIIVVLHHMPNSAPVDCVYLPALDVYAGKANNFTDECEMLVQPGIYLQYIDTERDVRIARPAPDDSNTTQKKYTFVHIAIVAGPPADTVRYDATLRHLCTRCTDRDVLATHISEEGLHAVCDDHRFM